MVYKVFAFFFFDQETEKKKNGSALTPYPVSSSLLYNYNSFTLRFSTLILIIVYFTVIWKLKNKTRSENLN